MDRKKGGRTVWFSIASPSSRTRWPASPASAGCGSRSRVCISAQHVHTPRERRGL